LVAQSISEIPKGLMKNGCTLKKYPRNVSKAKVPSTKKTWRDSLPIYMLLSAVSVLVVAQSIFEFPDGLMNNPVFNLLLLFAKKDRLMLCVPITL
jgi:hypothetical protein